MNITDVVPTVKPELTKISARNLSDGLYVFLNVDTLFNSSLTRKPEGEGGLFYYPWSGPSPAVLGDANQTNPQKIARANREFVSDGQFICFSPISRVLTKVKQSVFDLKYPTYGKGSPSVEDVTPLSSTSLKKSGSGVFATPKLAGPKISAY